MSFGKLVVCYEVKYMQWGTMKRWVTLSLFALTLFPSLAALATAHAQDRVRCAIHAINLNIVANGQNGDAYADRLDAIARSLIGELDSRNRSWDLVGLVGAYSRPQGTFPTFEEMHHPCRCYANDYPVLTAGEKLTTHCLADYFQRKESRIDKTESQVHQSLQKGEIGLIAKGPKFEILNGTVYETLLGTTWFGKARRRVVGARIRIRDTAHILPFYATHINPALPASRNKTPVYSTRKQVRDLVSAIKGWWQQGDLTPVVVGTFSFKRGSKSHDIMSRDFDELRSHYASEETGRVWIGKESSFSGASGRMEVVRYEGHGPFDRFGKPPSDHSIAYAELLTPGPDLRSLNIDHCTFKSRYALGSQPKRRCDRYELEFSWACNFIPRFTILINGHPYIDPEDGSNYAHKLCPKANGTMTMPINFLVPSDSYARTLTVEVETPDCSRSLDILLSRPAIKIFPYLHEGYAYTALSSQNPERFLRGVVQAYGHIEVIDQNPTADQIEARWDRRVFVHGRPIGDPHGPHALLIGFVINYKLGYVAKPIYCDIWRSGLVNPVGLSATIVKATDVGILETSKETELPFENCRIFDGFETKDYWEDISLTFEVEAIDSVGQNPRARQSFLADSLLCIVSPEYSELSIDLDSAGIWNTILDSVSRQLFTELTAPLTENERTGALTKFTTFKRRIATSVRASLARVSRGRRIWEAFRTAQRENYVEIEQEIFGQFASQATFDEARVMIAPLRQRMIETALTTPLEILVRATLNDVRGTEAVHHVLEDLLLKESDRTSWPP